MRLAMPEIADFLQKIAVIHYCFTRYNLIIWKSLRTNTSVWKAVLRQQPYTRCASSRWAVPSRWCLRAREDHADDPSYSGNTVFPLAGRIRGSRIGSFALEANDGPNCLHGGTSSRQACFSLSSRSSDSLTWTVCREAGEDGLPAARTYTTRYALDGKRLLIDMMMDSDRTVPCDMTSHLYFNLSGESDILNHVIQADSSRIVVNDSSHCAFAVRKSAGTDYDISRPRRLADVTSSPLFSFSKGLNNAYILDEGGAVRLSAGGLRLTGRSDSRAVVLYTGGYLEHPMSHIAIEFEDLPFSSTRQMTDRFRRHIEFSFDWD